ncbi:tRNA-specific adenosine deaminase, partial [Streptococcus suis]
MNYTQEEKEYFMNQALQEARKSLEKDEITIGCVILKDGQFIGR